MARINIEIKDDVHKQAKLNALLLGKTLGEYLNQAIEEKNKSTKVKQ